MFIPALSIIAPNWKQPGHPSLKEQINKLWSSRKMEYYLAIKRNVLLIHINGMY